MLDGLLRDKLLLLVPLHGAHHAGPDEADHGLLRDVVLLDLLPGVSDDLEDGLENADKSHPTRAEHHLSSRQTRGG